MHLRRKSPKLNTQINTIGYMLQVAQVASCRPGTKLKIDRYEAEKNTDISLRMKWIKKHLRSGVWLETS